MALATLAWALCLIPAAMGCTPQRVPSSVAGVCEALIIVVSHHNSSPQTRLCSASCRRCPSLQPCCTACSAISQSFCRLLMPSLFSHSVRHVVPLYQRATRPLVPTLPFLHHVSDTCFCSHAARPSAPLLCNRTAWPVVSAVPVLPYRIHAGGSNTEGMCHVFYSRPSPTLSGTCRTRITTPSPPPGLPGPGALLRDPPAVHPPQVPRRYRLQIQRLFQVLPTR